MYLFLLYVLTVVTNSSTPFRYKMFPSPPETPVSSLQSMLPILLPQGATGLITVFVDQFVYSRFYVSGLVLHAFVCVCVSLLLLQIVLLRFIHFVGLFLLIA